MLKMSNRLHTKTMFSVVFAAIALGRSVFACAAADAAKGLVRENTFFKCHGVEKDGPASNSVQNNSTGRRGAEQNIRDRSRHSGLVTVRFLFSFRAARMTSMVAGGF
jgi:hypothetical protein